ncbi:MAG: SDR family oxidoreductase [Rhodobacteraceae bacterium]|nr:SDR family oxidoreductase [Paracoccaceae bacterium]
MARLTGRRAFVTAAGQGIGRAIAEALAGEGAEVTAADLNPATLATLAGMATATLDVRDREAVARAAAATGPLDILVNAAGFVHHGTILDCDEDAWAFSVELNLTAMYRVTRAFLPGMLARGGGSIVCIASAVGSIQAAPNRFVYGATKAGVIGLVKAIAADYVARGIRCNAICPGTVESPSLARRIDALGATLPGGVEEARRLFLARQPSGRLGRPAEVAAAAVYLASDEAAFTTGTTLVVDGGWSNL